MKSVARATRPSFATEITTMNTAFRLRTVLIAANLGFAISFAVRSYLALPRQARVSTIIYGSLNQLFRLHIHHGFAIESFFLGVATVTGLCALMLLWVTRRLLTVGYPTFIDSVALVLALIAIPTGWITAVSVGHGPAFWWQVYPSFGINSPWPILAVNTSIAVVLAYISSKPTCPSMLSWVALITYYALWWHYIHFALYRELWPYTSFVLFAAVSPASAMLALAQIRRVAERRGALKTGDIHDK